MVLLDLHKFIAKCEHADGTEVSWKRPTNLQEPENVEYRILTEKRSERTMLNFPNQSRVFDPTRRAVRFWGHDSAMDP